MFRNYSNLPRNTQKLDLEWLFFVMGLWLMLSGPVWLSTRSPGCPVAQISKKGKFSYQPQFLKFRIYCWWLKSQTTSWYVKTLQIMGKATNLNWCVSAGFQPSTVSSSKRSFTVSPFLLTVFTLPTSRVKDTGAMRNPRRWDVLLRSFFDHIPGRSWFKFQRDKSMVP